VGVVVPAYNEAKRIGPVVSEARKYVDKVLVIDDDPNFAEGLCETLELEGFSCAHADSVSDAVKLATQLEPEVTLTDFQLPGATGFMICQSLKKALPETMIVLMASGNAAVISWSPADSIRTFSATIAAELGELVQGSPHYHVLFFIGAFLFVMTFIINLMGRWCVGKLQKKLQGAS